MTAGVPSGPETTYMLWLGCVCRHPTEPLRRRPLRSDGNRRAAWRTAERPETPERNELETPFGKLIVSGGGLMAAGTNRPGTLTRAHGDFNALVIGTEASL